MRITRMVTGPPNGHWSPECRRTCFPAPSRVSLRKLLVVHRGTGHYYINSCSVCAQTKSLRHAPAGTLLPLPVPQRPWAHLSIDFVTDLPSSDGFTTSLVVVDRFSKTCCLIPLSGLPTALQVAESLWPSGGHHLQPWAKIQITGM